jgi:hypothetical protein
MAPDPIIEAKTLGPGVERLESLKGLENVLDHCRDVTLLATTLDHFLPPFGKPHTANWETSQGSQTIANESTFPNTRS